MRICAIICKNKDIELSLCKCISFHHKYIYSKRHKDAKSNTYTMVNFKNIYFQIFDKKMTKLSPYFSTFSHVICLIHKGNICQICIQKKYI